MKIFKITTKLTNRDIASFNQYLKEVNDIPMLTPEEEVELTEKVINGDKAAADELVERNLRFVISVAKKYATDKIPLGDLVNEGNIGLIIAVNKFQPTMGYKFISFAVWWIRKIILEHISKHGKMVRLPANKINNLSKLDKLVSELEQKNNHRVDIQEVINAFGNEMSSDEFEFLDALSTFSVDSLDREINNDEGNSSTLGDLICDESDKSTDYLLNNSDVVEEINVLLETLKPRDKYIMECLFGLNGNPSRTLEEVGKDVNLTREMVRQVREKTLKKFKNSVRMQSAYENFV
jgi:RNA polymerase primary sigma factor